MSNQIIQAYWIPIFQHYRQGETALPLYMGLDEATFTSLAKSVGADVSLSSAKVESILQLRLELYQLRSAELEELETLLSDALTTTIPLGKEMVRVLACACLGSQHLWRDLGMPERPRLSALFRNYFPSLHAKNVNNMRWKRFLYRQLCENGGDYVCRSPSCEECTSYSECFDLSAKSLSD